MEFGSRCTYTFETIEAYVLNRLNKRARNQFEKHIDLCARCREAIAKEELFVAACQLVSIISSSHPDARPTAHARQR